MMDPNVDIKQYEKKWSETVEKASTKLFDLAVKVTEQNPNVKVVILKRMSRFDSKSQDPLSIKSKLSEFGSFMV